MNYLKKIKSKKLIFPIVLTTLCGGSVWLLCLAALYGCSSLTNNLAFHPDTESKIPVGQIPSSTQEHFIASTGNIQLQSYFLPHKSSDKLVIYFHGNAGNISHRMPDLIQLNHMGVNVLGISYRGYGSSTGKPSEDGIYEDGIATLNYATNDLNFKQENIFMLGRSIGTTVAINTAQSKNISGLILISPLTSGDDQAKEMGLGSISSIAGKSFNNIAKVKNISCPTIVIHGTHDRVIPLHMGESIYNELNTEKRFIKIQGANHNNLSTQYAKEYWLHIGKFITN